MAAKRLRGLRLECVLKAKKTCNKNMQLSRWACIRRPGIERSCGVKPTQYDMHGPICY